MPCTVINNTILCYNRQYRYKGFYFEICKWSGPWPLKKDGDPRENIPKGFYDAIKEFDKLSAEEKKKCEV